MSNVPASARAAATKHASTASAHTAIPFMGQTPLPLGLYSIELHDLWGTSSATGDWRRVRNRTRPRPYLARMAAGAFLRSSHGAPVSAYAVRPFSWGWALVLVG